MRKNKKLQPNRETCPRQYRYNELYLFFKRLFPSPSRKITIKYLLQRQWFKGREASCNPERQTGFLATVSQSFQGPGQSLMVEGKWERGQVSEDRLLDDPPLKRRGTGVGPGTEYKYRSPWLCHLLNTMLWDDTPSSLLSCMEYLRSLHSAFGCNTHLPDEFYRIVLNRGASFTLPRFPG